MNIITKLQSIPPGDWNTLKATLVELAKLTVKEKTDQPSNDQNEG